MIEWYHLTPGFQMMFISLCIMAIAGHATVHYWQKGKVDKVDLAVFSVLIVISSGLFVIQAHDKKEFIGNIKATTIEFADSEIDPRPELVELRQMITAYSFDKNKEKREVLIEMMDDFRSIHGDDFVTLDEQKAIIEAAPACFQGPASEYLIEYVSEYPLSTKIMQERIDRHLTMAGSTGLVPGCAMLN